MWESISPHNVYELYRRASGFFNRDWQPDWKNNSELKTVVVHIPEL